MLTAMLDTSVLWPSLQRDFLLSLAVERLYRPLWSEAILAELEFHEAAKLIRRGTAPVQAQQRAAGLVQVMRGAFDDALVTGWEHLEGGFGLPDPDDEHVVAAAVVGGAGVIVTSNARDFPTATLPPAVGVLGPAAFAATAVTVDPRRAARSVDAIAERSGQTGDRWTQADVLELLVSRYGMDEAVRLLRT